MFVTVNKNTLTILISGLVIAVLTILIGGGYFYGEYCKNTQQLKDMQEFAEIHKSVQYEILGQAYCYSPEGKKTREAKYIGNSLYRVK